MTIFLIRHGQTTGDLEDRYGGSYDDHLTEEARNQVESLATKLQNSGIEIIFSSPLIRAQETSGILGRRLGCRVETVKDIRERNMYGTLTGMVKAEAKEKHFDLVEQLKNHHHTIPNSEPYEQFRDRVTDALQVIRGSGYATVAILTHGGPISFIFREILKAGEVSIEDCGFAEFEDSHGTLSIKNLDGIAVKQKRLGTK